MDWYLPVTLDATQDQINCGEPEHFHLGHWSKFSQSTKAGSSTKLFCFSQPCCYLKTMPNWVILRSKTVVVSCFLVTSLGQSATHWYSPVSLLRTRCDAGSSLTEGTRAFPHGLLVKFYPGPTTVESGTELAVFLSRVAIRRQSTNVSSSARRQSSCLVLLSRGWGRL